MTTASHHTNDLPFGEIFRVIRGGNWVYSGVNKLLGNFGQVLLFPMSLFAVFFFIVLNYWLKRRFVALKAIPLNAYKYRKIREIYSTTTKDSNLPPDIDFLKKSVPTHLKPLLWSILQFNKTFEEFKTYSEPILRDMDLPGVQGNHFRHVPEKELWGNHVSPYQYLA